MNTSGTFSSASEKPTTDEKRSVFEENAGISSTVLALLRSRGRVHVIQAQKLSTIKCNAVDAATVELDIFTVILFSLYSRLVNNREIKLTLIIQRLLQYYSVSAAIVKIKYAK